MKMQTWWLSVHLGPCQSCFDVAFFRVSREKIAKRPQNWLEMMGSIHDGGALMASPPTEVSLAVKMSHSCSLKERHIFFKVWTTVDIYKILQIWFQWIIYIYVPGGSWWEIFHGKRLLVKLLVIVESCWVLCALCALVHEKLPGWCNVLYCNDL